MDVGHVHTAEDATPAELRRASILLLMLLVLGLLVVPIIRDLPLGTSTRTGLLAWLLVGLAIYWLSQGTGYHPLLLLQLLIFSTAATLLSAKVLLVIVDVNRVTFLRRGPLAHHPGRPAPGCCWRCVQARPAPRIR
jgi:hypothetical protein